MVKLVFIVLAGLSFYSWYVILERFFVLKEAARRNEMFQQAFLTRSDKNPEFPDSPLKSILAYGIGLRNKGYGENLDAYLEKAFIKEQGRMEKNLAILATIATISPFLGLLGTIWGLLISFQGIAASGTSSVSVVAE